MKKNYMVEVKLGMYIIFVPVTAIDEDDAKGNVMHILYWLVQTDVSIDIVEAKEVEDDKL